MWFAENPSEIDREFNIPIELFEIILFLFPRKIIRYNQKQFKFRFSDDYVIIFLLATITTTAKNTHTHSLSYNYI